MSNTTEKKCGCEPIRVRVSSPDWSWPMLILAFVVTAGDPDLLDALIHFLMQGGA